MKKYIMFLSVLILIPFAANAADDFGEMFSGQTPAALEDSKPGELSIETLHPALIEPASGDESESDTEEVSKEDVEDDNDFDDGYE